MIGTAFTAVVKALVGLPVCNLRLNLWPLLQCFQLTSWRENATGSHACNHIRVSNSCISQRHGYSGLLFVHTGSRHHHAPHRRHLWGTVVRTTLFDPDSLVQLPANILTVLRKFIITPVQGSNFGDLYFTIHYSKFMYGDLINNVNPEP